MPAISLTVTQNSLSKEEKAEYIEVLTSAFCEHAKQKGKGDIREHVSVRIFETAAGGYAVGGKIYG